MRYLEELEKKVLRLIERHQELQTRLDATTKENELLREQTRQFEASLLKESTATQSLTHEKAALIVALQLATDLAKNQRLLQSCEQKIEGLLALLTQEI